MSKRSRQRAQPAGTAERFGRKPLEQPESFAQRRLDVARRRHAWDEGQPYRTAVPRGRQVEARCQREVGSGRAGSVRLLGQQHRARPQQHARRSGPKFPQRRERRRRAQGQFDGHDASRRQARRQRRGIVHVFYRHDGHNPRAAELREKRRLVPLSRQRRNRRAHGEVFSSTRVFIADGDFPWPLAAARRATTRRDRRYPQRFAERQARATNARELAMAEGMPRAGRRRMGVSWRRESESDGVSQRARPEEGAAGGMTWQLLSLLRGWATPPCCYANRSPAKMDCLPARLP